MRGAASKWSGLSRPALLAVCLILPAAWTSAAAEPSPPVQEEMSATDAAQDPAQDSGKDQAAARDKDKEKAKASEAPPDISRRWRENAKVDLPPAQGGGRSRSSSYRALIERETAGTALAPDIAEAVMGVESGYNAGAIGGVGEIGLMQVLPSTARMLGFSGSDAELAAPENNIHYGVMYLAQAWRLAGGDLCTAVMKYRAGHGETRFSHLSVNYCLAVRSRLMAKGFHVTGAVPVATFGEPGGGGGGGGGCKRRCMAGLGGRSLDFAKMNARLSALVVQVRAGR